MTMKPTCALLLVLGCGIPLHAQNLDTPKPEKEISAEVQKAIDEFNRLKATGKEKDNEVSVVLEPPAPRAIAVPEDPVTGDEEATDKKAVLVSGKPPSEEDQAAPAEETDPDEKETESVAKPTEEPGLEIRVESIRKGNGNIDPKLVKLKTSFPPKPLATPPADWAFEKSDHAPLFKREVELKPGTVISLDIPPHVLAPVVDGSETFSVNEPGFIPIEGYRQAASVSSILGKSIVQLDEDSKQLGDAMADLHRLLASLPKPEIQPEGITKP